MPPLNKGTLSREIIPGSGLPSNPNQVAVEMWLNGPQTMVATQASTALFTGGVIQPSLGALTKTSSWKAVWEEYRLIALDFMVIPVTLANGATLFVLDDADATAPDSTWANSSQGLILSNNSSCFVKPRRLKYRSADVVDLQWRSTYSDYTYTPMALKMYTDAANWGSPTSTNLWIVRWRGLFQFRGAGVNN